MKKENEFSSVFGHNIIYNGLYHDIILANETTELVLLYHKNIAKLVFLWLNIEPKMFQRVKNDVSSNSLNNIIISTVFGWYLIPNIIDIDNVALTLSFRNYFF